MSMGTTRRMATCLETSRIRTPTPASISRSATAAITAFCRERLASYKVPARLAFRAAGEFPRTPTGKIHKPGLRQELAQELATDGTS